MTSIDYRPTQGLGASFSLSFFSSAYVGSSHGEKDAFGGPHSPSVEKTYGDWEDVTLLEIGSYIGGGRLGNGRRHLPLDMHVSCGARPWRWVPQEFPSPLPVGKKMRKPPQCPVLAASLADGSLLTPGEPRKNKAGGEKWGRNGNNPEHLVHGSNKEFWYSSPLWAQAWPQKEIREKIWVYTVES